jgi:oxygen-dependent protoporphyrinogen oxidase
VPAVEGRRLQGVTYLSEKWRGRTPSPDFALIRAFVGGARQQGLLEGGEEAVRAAAREELGVLLGIRGDPVAEWVHLWRPGLPQYTLGHLTRLASAEQALAARAPAVRLAGASYHGIGLPDCVASGWRAADGLRAALAPRPSPAAGGSPP